MSRMCNNFIQQGHCRFGDRCTFKHGNNDNRDLNALAASKPCFNFQRGQCHFGPRCRFSHGGGHVAGHGGGHGGGHSSGHGGGHTYRGGHRGGHYNRGPRIEKKLIKHTLPSEGIKVYVDNRITSRLFSRKIVVYKDLVARGTRGSAWRGLDARIPEIVAFGGTHLNKTLLAISAVSQQRPNTIYLFWFDPNTGKQESELNRLVSLRQRSGPGNLFNEIFRAIKGTTDIEKIVIKKSAQEKQDEKEEEEARLKAEYDALNTEAALDAQVAKIKALALAEKKSKAQNKGIKEVERAAKKAKREAEREAERAERRANGYSSDSDTSSSSDGDHSDVEAYDGIDMDAFM